MSNVDLFMVTLPYLGTGLLAIFVVTGVIVLAISALNKLGAAKKEKKED